MLDAFVSVRCRVASKEATKVLPVEIVASQLGDIYIVVLDPSHSRKTICNVGPDDINVLGGWMLDGRDEDAFLFT
jgi:hypothetical protein